MDCPTISLNTEIVMFASDVYTVNSTVDNNRPVYATYSNNIYGRNFQLFNCSSLYYETRNISTRGTRVRDVHFTGSLKYNFEPVKVLEISCLAEWIGNNI